MTDHITSQSTRATHAQVAKEAALIANFYGKREGLDLLLGRLVDRLHLKSQGPNDYANKATGALLRHFDPPAASAHDTTIIQMALNRSGAAEAAWEAMRKQLEDILPNDELLDELLKHVWGYTLIYQAELTQEAISDGALTTLLPAVQRLGPPLSECPQKLAQADMPGGRLWLIDIPVQGEGLQAATVYLALSQPNSNNRLVREVLYNPVAPLLMVDLIAHKGYYQIRQYRLGNLDEQYRQKMERLTKDTNTLLHNLARVSVTAEQLDVLASEYGLLVSAVVHLNQLHASLMRQKFNFNWWRKQAGGDDIIAFHRRHLKDATQELELLVAEGQYPLEAASTAVEMMKARLDKQQEDQQRRIQTTLSAAAVVLSVLVLMDKPTVGKLLELVGVRFPSDLIETLLELGVQVAFIVAISLLALLVVRLRGRARHPR